MNLTPGQVRDALDLAPETFRHWKKTLPPIAERNGRRASYTLGDLLALAIVRALVENAGVRVGALHAVAATLFDQCRKQAWTGFERSLLVLELARVRVTFISDSHFPKIDAIGIVVPCGPIISDLRERLLVEKSNDDQTNLQFAPTVVAGRERGRRVS
jgi:hypothetical protein